MFIYFRITAEKERGVSLVIMWPSHRFIQLGVCPEARISLVSFQGLHGIPVKDAVLLFALSSVQKQDAQTTRITWVRTTGLGLGICIFKKFSVDDFGKLEPENRGLECSSESWHLEMLASFVVKASPCQQVQVTPPHWVTWGTPW